MRRPIFLVLSTIMAGGLGAAPAAVSAAPAGPVLLRDHQAAQFSLRPPAPVPAHTQVIQPDTQVEPSIAVNPANNQNAVAAYQEGRVAGGGDMTQGWATTFDGGRTWTYGDFPCLTYTVPGPGCPNGGPYDRASDAVVAFGPGNTVYANHLIFNDQTGGALTSAIAVNVSKDGGRTWGPPVVFQDDPGGGLNDKNWIVVDNSSAPGHHKGRVYVVWDRVAPIVYNYCDANCDQKSNWLPNFLVLYPGQGISSIPVVMPSGNLGVFFETDAASPITTPTDQPVSVVPGSGIDLVLFPVAGALPVPVPLLVPRGVTDDQGKAVRQQRASDGTLIDAEVDQVSGRLYVVWADGRSRSDGVNDAYLTTSSDGGLTWSPQVRVNPGSTSDFVDHYNVTVAVGPDGSVRVSYRQRQEAPTVGGFSPNIDTYYQQSVDHGTTWSAPLRVNTVRTSVWYGAFSRNGIFEGDYNEIAAGGPYSYIVRAEAYAVTANEPHGLIVDPSNPEILTGNPAGCARGTLTPACMTHIHQRTWVAVVGPAVTGAGFSPPPVSAATPLASALPALLPNTAVAEPAAWFLAGVAMLLIAGAFAARRLLRRRG
jgi:hypothetical protein